MGYYSDFSLYLIGSEQDAQAFKKTLKEKHPERSALHELLDEGYTNAKLYEIEDWLAEAAAMYPDLLVHLYVVGEEDMDIWAKRWKGTDSEQVVAILPEFKRLTA